MTNEKHITIIGATGKLGVPIVKNLVGMGYRINAIVRNREKAKTLFSAMPQIQISEADLKDVSALKFALKNTEYLYLNLSTLSTDLNMPFSTERDGIANILSALNKNYIKQIICISGLGAFDIQQNSAIVKFIPNIIRKQGHKLIKESGIPYTFLHCTWFVDNFVLYRRKKTYMVIGDTQNPIYFTNCFDFSRALANAIGNPKAFFKEFPIQGTEGLKHPEAAKLFFSEFCKNTRVKIAPTWIFGLLALFNKEMKYVKHMSDYFSKSKEEFLAEECGTYDILGKPEFGIARYAKKLKNEAIYEQM